MIKASHGAIWFLPNIAEAAAICSDSDSLLNASCNSLWIVTLSFMGLPCPNLSTGGANFHGVHEFIPIQSMEKMVEVIIELMKNQ